MRFSLNFVSMKRNGEEKMMNKGQEGGKMMSTFENHTPRFAKAFCRLSTLSLLVQRLNEYKK